jgi:hypothetical protein
MPRFGDAQVRETSAEVPARTFFVLISQVRKKGWEKGVRHQKCKATLGPFRFSVSDTFFPTLAEAAR